MSGIDSCVVWWHGWDSDRRAWSTNERNAFAGTSKAHSIGVLQLAVKAIFAHSQVPLVMIPLVGAGLFVTSILALIALTIDWVRVGACVSWLWDDRRPMVMLFGILFCLLGIVSIYIGLIYEEVKGRPNFVIRQTLGMGGLVFRKSTTKLSSAKTRSPGSRCSTRSGACHVRPPTR